MRARLTYAAYALATIVLGLWVHRGGLPLHAVARDVIGDALWAAMMFWWVSAAVPTARVFPRAVVALGICSAVEFSQLVHVPWLDAARTTTAGRLVLGSGFDARDLLAYAIGVTVAVALCRSPFAAVAGTPTARLTDRRHHTRPPS